MLGTFVWMIVENAAGEALSMKSRVTDIETHHDPESREFRTTFTVKPLECTEHDRLLSRALSWNQAEADETLEAYKREHGRF